MPPPSLSLYGLALGLAVRARVSVKAMTVSLSVFRDSKIQGYRHRYRQFSWLQAIAGEHPQERSDVFRSILNNLVDASGRA